MSNTTEEPTAQDLMRVIQRDRFVKEQLSSRIASLVQENLELLSVVNELQRDMADIQQGQQLLASDNGEMPAVVPMPSMEQQPLFTGRE